MSFRIFACPRHMSGFNRTPLCRPIMAKSAFTSSTSLSSSKASNTTADGHVVFSENQPADLPHRLSHLEAWDITPSKMGISRHFTFSTFGAAWKFMNLVADECKAKRHHPSWHNLYNEVTIEWTTHKPQGLSIKDIEMAEFCDKTAQEIGLKAVVPK